MKLGTVQSPRSGRSVIAQRFIAKDQALLFNGSPRSGRQSFSTRVQVPLSVAVSRALKFLIMVNPALKCWAIASRPLRGLI